jgi:hypothetical protein
VSDPDKGRVIGTSLESFTEATAMAFSQIKGDPGREGAAAASVLRMWVTKGGFVGRNQYHVELEQISEG